MTDLVSRCQVANAQEKATLAGGLWQFRCGAIASRLLLDQAASSFSNRLNHLL